MWNPKGDARTSDTDSSGKSLLSLPNTDKTTPQAPLSGSQSSFFKRQRPRATTGFAQRKKEASRPRLVHQLYGHRLHKIPGCHH